MRQLKVAMVFVIIGGLLTTAAFFMAFYWAEVQSFGTVTVPQKLDTVRPLIAQTQDGFVYGKAWFSQKIFYFHVPVAEASFLVLLIAAYFSVRFLMTKRKDYDTKARVAMEVALVFTTLTMVTGVLWTKASWNVWWEWEPRLTTYFIMLLLIIAYFVLRNSIEDEERRATYAAVFGIIAFIDAPISFAITRIIPSSVHPVVLRSGGGLEGWQLWAFLIGLFGMLMLAWSVYQVRLREEFLKDRLDVVKAELEG